jgi:hypothetical protein
MKRALIVLPLFAIILALAAWLLRRPGSDPFTPKPAPAAPVAPTAHPHDHELPKAPLPAFPPDAAPGALHFVVTMRGQPVAGARIIVHQVGVDRNASFQTEADGTQLLKGLPAGEFQIAIEQDDALPYPTETLVAPGQTVEIVADLKVGGKVYGRITNRGGQPVPDTRVFLLDAATGVPPDGKVALSDKEGRYALKGLGAGNFHVRYRHVEYKPLDRKGLVFRGGADDYPIDVVLEVGAKISGKVLDDAGAPIEGADLIGSNGESAGIAKSAADGSFSVTGLTDPPANISAAKAGYGKVVKRNLSGNPTDVIFQLPKAGTLLGALVIDQTPRQIQVILSRYDDELKQEIPVDPRFFSFISTDTPTFAFADVSPGTYSIDVQAEGYEQIDRPQVAIASGQITREVRISMRKKN